MRTIQFSIKASIVAFLFAAGVGCTYDTTVDQPYAGPIDGLDLFTGNIETASTTPISVTWNSEDKVGVFAGTNANKTYLLRENMNSSAVFEPEDATAIDGPIDRIYAYTPYDANATMVGNMLSLTIPAVQPYQAGGTAPGVNPMVASASTRSVFFKHVCGVVKLKLSNTEFGTVRKVTMTTLEGAPLGGPCQVDLDFGFYDNPQPIFGEEAVDAITIDCSAEPIKITTAGYFLHFVVAPGTYESVVFHIENTDGEVFESRTKEPLTVTRGQIADAGLARIYIEEFFYGKANCIQHAEPGTYTFDVSPYFTTDSYGYAYEFNTRETLVLASSADLLWQSCQDMITNVTLSDDKKSITFTAAKQGNALVAIRDAEGTILWSFHLWISPVESILYPNGWYVFDRNLGARSSDPKDEMATWGLYYQWGRKDPMPELQKPAKITTTPANNFWASGTYYKMDNSEFRITAVASGPGVDQYYAIKHPTTFIQRAGSTNVDWLYASSNDRLWGNPEGSTKPKIETIQKSIYDPCPEGYMVAPLNILSANGVKTGSLENFPFYGTTAGEVTDFGRMLTTDGINQWYPAARQYHNNMSMALTPPKGLSTRLNDLIVRIWTSAPKTAVADGKARALVFGPKEAATYPEWEQHRAFGYNVRCVKVVSGQ
ncbi:MAG: hypothetical protein IJF77_06070 [Alistipes sp.]|nr:hypothetical protein [Alistipes sp.]